MDGVLLVTGLAVAGAVSATALAVQNNWNATRRAVQARTVGTVTSARTPLLLVPRLPALSEKGRRMAFELERAGLPWTVKEYFTLRAVAAAALALLTVLVVAPLLNLNATLTIIGGIIGFALGAVLPDRYVAFKRDRRKRLVEDQLLEALVSMAKSMKAGVGLTQALDYAGREAPEPLGSELKRVVRELQLGADLEVVLEQMNNRIGSPDLEITSTAIIIQRRVGGNLSEILTNVSNTIRERKTIRRELAAITAKGKLQGNISAMLPVAVAALFLLINHDTARLLFTSTTGNIALAFAIFFELFGLWLIRRFATIEV